MPNKSIVRFSIDIEAGGDTPDKRPLLEVGICEVDNISKSSTFIFKPDLLTFDREAISAIRRPIEEFISKGETLEIGINKMLDYIDNVASGRKMEFVGLNMGYDWTFFRTVVPRFMPLTNSHTNLTISLLMVLEYLISLYPLLEIALFANCYKKEQVGL